MVYILATAYSFLSSLRLPTQILWTLVIMAFGISINDTSQGWGMYHYYVGAKYFAEVGYFDLYECTIDQAQPRRNLKNYDYRVDSPDCPADFDQGRYKNFQADIIASGFYDQALIDKGYNGTPTWTAIFGTLANWDIFTPGNAYLVDVIALFLALVYCIYALGWRKSAYIVLIILTYHGTFDRLWGHYGQWVWLALALIGVASLQRKSNTGVGAYLIGISASLAIFPAFLMLKYRSKKQIILFVVGLLTFLSVGLANGRGIDGYFEFIQNISLHSSYVRTEACCNIGLAHSTAFLQHNDRQYLACFVAWSADCPQHYDNHFNPLLWLLAVPLVLTSPLGVMYGLLTLSTYYYLVLAVVAVWYRERWSRLILFINGLIWVCYINDWFLHSRNLLYFVFFLALGVYEYNVIQNIPSIISATQSRLYTTIAQRHVSQ